MSLWMKRALALSATIATLPALGATPADKPGKKQPAAAKPASAGENLALVDGVAITNAQVEERASGQLAQLRAQEYELRERTIEMLISDALVNKAASAQGLSSTEYLRAEIDNKVTPVTEDEKKATFEKYKSRLQQMPEAEAMKQVEEYLRRQRTDERRNALLAELRGKAQVRMLMEPPRKNVEAVGPSKGPANAPITIVEFSDFECPYCSRAKETVDQVLARYGDSVRLVFRDFPLPMHANAPKAAEAGACADEQGKFWPLHDKMFADQKALGVDALKKSAVDVGLDATKFNECLDSGKYAADWKKDTEAGQAQGVTGTPAFFINGRFINGAVPMEAFSKVIDDELGRKGLPVPPAPKPQAAATPTSD